MKHRLLGYAAGGLLRLYLFVLSITSRIIKGNGKPPAPAVYALWHGHLLLMPILFHAVERRRTVILTSQHGDGQIAGYVARSFGYKVIHGSSTHGGRQAARALVQSLKEGYNVVITPDAPPQKAYQCSPGAERIAAMAGVPLVAVVTRISCAKVLDTKDRFTLPLPFGKIELLFRPVPPSEQALARTLRGEL